MQSKRGLTLGGIVVVTVPMPRRRVELSTECPYHICARSNNRDWFLISLDEVLDIYVNVLEKTISQYEIQIHGFVLMSNHFHMLIATPLGNLSPAMRYFMTETSRAIARRSKRINRIYGARYHWTIIRSSEHFAHAMKYIYLNPVKAEVTQRAEEYKWSSLSRYHKRLNTLMRPNTYGFNEYIPPKREDLIKWVNNKQSDAYSENVRRALRRHEFKFTQNKITGKRPTFYNALPPKNTPGTKMW